MVGYASNIGVTICKFEAAYLSDVVMAFLMDKRKNLFKEASFNGLYCNNKLVVFDEVWNATQLMTRLESFQPKIIT